jgi:hypothetical protein
MEDCTTSLLSSRWEDRRRLALEDVFFEDLLLLLTLLWDLEVDFFFTLWVGTEYARLGVNARARVIIALKINRFVIQNLLGYGTIPREPSLAPDKGRVVTVLSDLRPTRYFYLYPLARNINI